MGKDSTSNVLYILGALGSILLVIIAAYYLSTHFFTLPDYTFITGWVNVLAVILVAFAFLGIYRDFGSIVPIIAMIFFLISQIIPTLALLNILGPFILTLPDPVTAELALIWASYIIWIIAFLLAGFSVYMSRGEVGGVATIAGIIFMIWGFIRFVLRYLDLGLGPSIYDQLWFAGVIIIYIIAFVYFLLAMRS